MSHKEQALHLLDVVNGQVSENYVALTGERKDVVIAEAQVHATLELAEQQRVANFVSYLRIAEIDRGGRDTRTAALSREVEVALGLRDPKW